MKISSNIEIEISNPYKSKFTNRFLCLSIENKMV